MTKDDIIALPHDSLRQRSKRVGVITEEILTLVNNMQRATLDWEASREHEVGVALAAIQVNALLRVIVIRHNFDEKNDTRFDVYINPQITKYEGDIEEDFEGCLSVKDIYGKVPRHTKIRIKAISLEGKEIRLTATGFLARVFQHEIDHTNGVMFVDHIRDNPEAFFRLEADGHLTALDYEKDVESSKALWG